MAEAAAAKALVAATTSGALPELRRLVQDSPSAVNVRGSAGNTPIHVAVALRCRDALQIVRPPALVLTDPAREPCCADAGGRRGGSDADEQRAGRAERGGAGRGAGGHDHRADAQGPRRPEHRARPPSYSSAPSVCFCTTPRLIRPLSRQSKKSYTAPSKAASETVSMFGQSVTMTADQQAAAADHRKLIGVAGLMIFVLGLDWRFTMMACYCYYRMTGYALPPCSRPSGLCRPHPRLSCPAHPPPSPCAGVDVDGCSDQGRRRRRSHRVERQRRGAAAQAAAPARAGAPGLRCRRRHSQAQARVQGGEAGEREGSRQREAEGGVSSRQARLQARDLQGCR